MNIAIIVSSLQKAGPVIVAADQIKMLTAHGHHCELFYFDETDEKIVLTCSSKRITLKTRIDFSQYDVVHCHTGRPCLYVTIHKPLFCKTKFITTFHNYVYQNYRYYYGPLKGFFAGFLYLLLALRFDRIITLSEDARRYYKRLLFFKKYETLYNTVDANPKPLTPEDRNELLQFKGNSKLLGINASLYRLKGQDLVISILPQLPDCKLILLGTGKEEVFYRNLAEKYAVSDRIYWAGFRKNAVDYLLYYDLFLFPSNSEGCPLALLEAASINKKIVCSDIPVHKEMFSGTEVTFFSIKDPKSLLPAIINALSGSDKQPKLQKHFQETFSSEIIYNRLIEIYLRKK